MTAPWAKGPAGQPRRRVDGRAKVTGETRFADDLSLPRMLHARLLRSPHPHALIRRVDATAARRAPGVKLVLTGEDFRVPYGILPVSQDELPLCREKVRFVGDPVVAVVALTEEQAEEALRLVEVDYEPLPTIATPEEALRSADDPRARLHAYGDGPNLHKRVALEFGDVDAAFASAPHVFEDVVFYEGSTHLPIEQHATLAALEPDGKLCVWSSTQTPHYLHRALARALEMPASAIRVIATPNGGGFGGKSDPFNHEIVVARAALVTGRPVKICLSREEVFYCHRGRHPVLVRTRTGVDADGRLLAMDVETLLDGGAYGSYGVASTFYTGALQTVTYHVPRYRFRGCRTFTNKPPCGPKRGHGTPQGRFALEVQLDKIAVALGLSPAELRRRQLCAPGALTANFLRLGTIGLGRCLDEVVAGSRFEERWQKLPRGKGVGLACSAYLCGAGLPIYFNDMPHSGVQLLLDRSGSVTAFSGATEIGQGSDDTLAALVAEVLGLRAEEVRLVTGDTGLTPVDLGSYSSRVTLMMGQAALEAAEKARALVAGAVGRAFGVAPGQVGFAGGRVFVPGAGEAQDLSFAEAVALAESQLGTLATVGSYRPPRSPARFKGGGVGPSPAYSYSAAVVEVEVDEETGWVEVRRVDIAHDVGRALNPVSVRGQIEGSVYMALGEALMEEQAFRRLPPRRSAALVHKHPSLLEYKSPTTHEMPEVHTYLVEDPEPAGPLGAKEVGQGPLLPILPAVCNAIFDAVGVRVDEVPVTPEKVLRALELGRASGRTGRVGPAGFPRVPWPEPLRVAPPWEGGDGSAVRDGKPLSRSRP